MTPFIIYGTKGTLLQSAVAPSCLCNHCNTQADQTIGVFGRYAYLYWIPLFPIGKKAVVECQNCLKTSDENWSPELQEAVSTLKEHTKGRKRHWFGAAILGPLILLIAISIITHEDDPRLVYLEQDSQTLSAQPAVDFPADSLAARLDLLFSLTVVEEMVPDDFQYTVKQLGSKTLAIINIPTLGDLDKSVWPELADMATEILTADDENAAKEIYVAIYGGQNLSIRRGPTGSDETDLLAYYGDVVVEEE